MECRFEADLATCDTHFPLTLSGFAIRDPSKFFAKASDDLTAHAHVVGRRLLPPASASPAP